MWGMSQNSTVKGAFQIFRRLSELIACSRMHIACTNFIRIKGITLFVCIVLFLGRLVMCPEDTNVLNY